MRKEKRHELLCEIVGLGPDEVAEVAAIAEVGSYNPFKKGNRAGSMVTAATVAAIGGTMVMQRRRWGVVLTNQRLVFVDVSSRTARGWSLIGAIPRDEVHRSEVRSRVFLWFDLFDDAAQKLARLSFPLPNRAEGRQVADALTPVDDTPRVAANSA